MRNKLLSLLNIRNDEAWLVTNLFWLQFFQGAGVAIFNTVAFAFFLQQFEVTELPKVYLFSAVLLLLFGWLYSKVEHALPVKTVVLGVILFIAISILLFRLQFFYTNAAWFFFLMFSWYYVIYLLNNLEFWGVAALSFDIRQSKRLFGMIGAGDIPAKLIGYSAVPIFVRFIGNENMLLVAFASILISLVFYFRLRKAGKLDLHVKHAHGHAHGTHAGQVTQSLVSIVKSFFGNRMIAMIALLSFIVVTCVTIISFSFYAEIKHQMHSDEQLASFIGIFFAAGRVLAIVIRLIFTGRITSILGTKGTLLVSPVILFGFFFAIIVLPFISSNEHAILYIFGLMAVLTEVLKTSLQDPVFLSLMQPLTSQLRLKGHTIVKGVMDPFALAFSGFMLFSVLAISHHVDLFMLSYLLFALLIIWVVMIFFVDREYVRTLVTALNKRYSIGQEINLADDKTQEVLKNKVLNGEPGEAIYILNLLEKNYTTESEPMILQALQHPKTLVKLEAIKVAERQKILAALPAIDAIIDAKTDIELLPEAVKAKCLLQPDELQAFEEFLAENNPLLIKAAITGFMTSGGIAAVVTAGQKLLQLISSDIADERLVAAEIIGDLRVQSFYKPLLALLDDKDAEVVKAAIVAAGKVSNEKLMPTLMNYFINHQHEKLVVDAFEESGDVALNEIREVLITLDLSRRQQSKLVLLCGRIGTENAVKVLDELIWAIPTLRSEIFHALHLCMFKSQPHNKQSHIELINKYLHSASMVLFMIKELQQVATAKVLADALYIELDEIRDSLLLLFSFVYDRDKMMRAKNAFHIKNKESIANALEILEIEVPKEVASKFIIIYEPGDITDKCNALKANFKEEMKYERIIEEILHNTNHHFHRWTKAAALHSVIFYKGNKRQKWLEHAHAETDTLLNEAAHLIIRETVQYG